MGIVAMNSEDRWTKGARDARVEQHTRGAGGNVMHDREHTLLRRMLQIQLPVVQDWLAAHPAPTDGSPDPYAVTRMFVAQAVPLCKPLTLAQAQEAGAAALAFTEADAVATAIDADIALLHARQDYDALRRALAALPEPAPTDGTDDPLDPDARAAVEAQRTDLQAQLDAAPADVLAEVARHDAWLAEQSPPEPDPPADQPPTEEGAPA